MYVAVKGGEKAISAAHELLRREGRGDPSVPDLGIDQLIGQLRLAVDRVMAEGSLYDRDLAALAIKQAQGDLLEAVFLVRAYRTTLPRFGSSLAVDTSAMRVLRRISATWKDLPGGQILGATFDYTHRLLDRTLSRAEAGAAGSSLFQQNPIRIPRSAGRCRVRSTRWLRKGCSNGPSLSEGDVCRDITRHPLELPADAPADRGVRLPGAGPRRRRVSARHGLLHAARLRRCASLHRRTAPGMGGSVFFSEELGFDVVIGEIELTECETVSRYTGTARPPCFTRGYGLVFGNNERKALSMSITDRALRAKELDEPVVGPAQNPEFVLLHGDNVDASGFVQHIKLPHYVDFQADLSLYPRLARQAAERQGYLDATDRRLRGRAA